MKKISYGVVCFRYNKGLEVLIVRKRYTYAFADFVYGKYKDSSEESIMPLLNNMTVAEKLEIMSGNFGNLWSKIWLVNPMLNYGWGSIHFNESKTKYKENFSGIKQFSKLVKCIEKSKSEDLHWEVPKGKKNRGESDFYCANREFIEELGIEKSDYMLLHNFKPIVYSFADAGQTYIYKYYIGLMHRNENIEIDMSKQEQIFEIDAIKWVKVSEIEKSINHKKLTSQIIKISKILKKQIKYKKHLIGNVRLR